MTPQTDKTEVEAFENWLAQLIPPDDMNIGMVAQGTALWARLRARLEAPPEPKPEE